MNIFLIQDLKTAGHAKFKTFRIVSLSCDECVAKNVEFRSNEVSGQKFDIAATDQDHSYAVYWTLNLKVADANGTPVKNAEVTILDKDNSIVLQTKTGEQGKLKTELPEYFVNNKDKKISSPYTISVGNCKKEIVLDGNKEISCVIN